MQARGNEIGLAHEQRSEFSRRNAFCASGRKVSADPEARIQYFAIDDANGGDLSTPALAYLMKLRWNSLPSVIATRPQSPLHQPAPPSTVAARRG
jgi:hypothetical protein